MNYFTPADLKQLEATYNYTARAGLGFAITPDNEQVFVPARDVERLGLGIGDTIRVWATDNYASPHTAQYPSRWRAVRVELVTRVDDFVSGMPNATMVPAAPVSVATPEPAKPHVTDFVGVMDTLMNERRPWSVNELTHAIAKASLPLSGMPDLIQKVGGRLHTQHKNGDVACLRVFARGDNDRASAVYYAEDVDVFYDHLDAPLADEE